MGFERRSIVACVVTMAALSSASAQQPTRPPFQPLTVVASTMLEGTGSSTWDRVLRAISHGLQDRIEHSTVLRFESLQKANVHGVLHDPGSVMVQYTGGAGARNADGDPAMLTIEWYIAGPMNCPSPAPKYHGTVPMQSDGSDAAPVVAALITTLESIAKESDRCQT